MILIAFMKQKRIWTNRTRAQTEVKRYESEWVHVYRMSRIICLIGSYDLWDTLCTGCSLNIVFFLQMLWFFWTLPVLLQRLCSTCLVCVHTRHRGKTEKGKSPEYLKICEKNTISNELPVLYYNISGCLDSDKWPKINSKNERSISLNKHRKKHRFLAYYFTYTHTQNFDSGAKTR